MSEFKSLHTGKLAPRVQEEIYLRPAGEVVHYHCILMLGTSSIKMARDVYFIEDQLSEAALKLVWEHFFRRARSYTEWKGMQCRLAS